jgi:DNA/RNA endonuclease YhcR with UshA esterase domain
MKKTLVSPLEMRLTIFAAVIVLLTVSTTSFAQGPKPIVSIAEAEKMSLGSDITIEGSVTVGSGTFRSSFDDEGFQIEDKTGGMYIAIKTDLHLKIGQRVRLIGKLNKTPLGFPIIETEESLVHILPNTRLPKPLRSATGKVTDSIVGRLIRISGTVSKPVEEVAPYGFRVSINDGSGEIIAYISTSTNISPKRFAAGQKVELTGVAGKFKSRYQIYPRSTADVLPVPSVHAKKNKVGA